MKTYIVTVKVHTVQLYEVEAETPDEAMELWQDGTPLKCDFARMEAEALTAEEKEQQP
ncbi:MAG: hypothetical protein AB7I48_02285 [Planctomycetaceae bacterium]